mgnify:CR=1 FL=1
MKVYSRKYCVTIFRVNKFKHNKKMPICRRFKPGQSGNPRVAPKKTSVFQIYFGKLGLSGTRRTSWEGNWIFWASKRFNTINGWSSFMIVYTKALEGQSWAINLIVDRTEGKPTQTIIQKDSNKPDFTKVEFVRFKR